ncbi:polycystin family receptor for egg jelly [Mixophyes fleayi]|uniref:polycystin family receptor for egg jelly n=1 Tax=Mixophyes fleayi TaxID=3061075 RepID=UPI003F4DD079
MGKTSDSQVHHLKCPGHQVFIRGGLDTFLVTARTTLGDISNIRIWHNNAGDSPGWFLSRVKVENMRTKQVWYFVCQNWFDIGKNDGLIHREFVPLKTHTPLDKLHYFYIQLSFKFCEDHLWFSIFLTALPGAFNRFRRLSCCLVILMSTLLVNIIFFNAAKNEDDEPKIHFLRSVMVGVESSLIAVPIQYLVLILLRLTEDKPSSQIHPFSESKLQDDTFYRSLNAKANNLEERLETFYQKQDNKDTAMEINSDNSGLHPLSLASFPTKQHISRQLHCDNFHRQLNNCVISEAAANKIDTFSETAVEMQRQNFKRIGIGKKPQVIYIKRIQQMSSFVPPWWCIYVAWSFVFITSSISAVLIIMYGLTYGYELSFTWLLASAMSFFQSVFVIEIVKIVFLIAFTSYFPKFYQDISWASSCFPEISLYEVPTNTDEARELHYKLVALRNTKQYKPPHDDEITILRKIATIKRKSYIFFRSLVSHIIFLTLLLHFVYSKDTSVFHYNQEIRKRFSYNLHRVHRVDQIYNWTSEVFLPLIHDHKQPGFVVESRSKIVGLPRMRQVKATYCNHTGSSLYVLFSDVLSCVKKYGIGEDFESSTVNKEFNPSEYTGYTYESSIPHWNYTLVGGKFGSGGYTAYFFPAKDLAHSLNRIQQLQNTNWLCEGMWAVVIELSAFNPDAHLFCSISIIFEAFDFGRLNPELSVHSFTMYTFQDLDSTNTFIILAFIAFLVIYTVSEIHAIVKLKKNYINVTNVINLFLKCLLFLSVVFYLTKLILAPFLLHLYSLYPNQFIPFYIVSYVDMMFKDTLGFLAHFTLLKSLRYTKYIYHVRLAEKALMTALSGICSMSLVVFICFIAFASFGYLVFGQAEWNYHTFLYATRTVFSYCISCFSKSSLDNNSFLCVLYLFLFLFVMSCVIINLFQVVILSTYGGMKHPVFEEASDEAEMIDFLVYKIRLAWVHLLKKHPEKCERETTSSALYGKPQHKMENTVGLKRRKVSGKKTSILFI